MEMFNKLKAKLAEELDSESESNASLEYRGPRGAASGESADNPDRRRSSAATDYKARAMELEAEVLELKEHINKNYFVYVKRLEKRKERIKELEEYAKLLLKDNDALTEKLKELEGTWVYINMSFGT